MDTTPPRPRPRDVDSQQQSLFFRLPVEIRAQIQVEYLAEHLRGLCASKPNNFPPSHYQPLTNGAVTRRFSTPLSPLSRSCRRMYHEMRPEPCPRPGLTLTLGTLGALGVGRLPLPVPARTGSAFGFFHVKNDIGSVFVTEGRFQWSSLRRLRFVNEMDHPGSSYGWPNHFIQVIRCATHLSELEFEWNPRMSFIHGEYIEKITKAIESHPSIRTVRLRGNAPKPLLESKPGAIPGKRIVVEPLILWPAKDPAEDEKIDRARAEKIAEAKARVHAQIERLATMDQERRRPSRCRCRFLGRRYRKLVFW